MLVELTPVVEVVVRLKDFLNIDLHQRGYYHIRSRLKLCPKHGAAKTELKVPRSPNDAVHTFPASVVEGQAVGTTIEILYSDENLALNDTVRFTLHLASRVDRLPPFLQLFLHLELWFCEKDEMLKKSKQDLLEGFRCLSKRCVRLRVSVGSGLHAFRPVLFDYTSLAAVTFSVHASLTGLEASAKKSVRSSPSASPTAGAKVQAYHREAARALLAAQEALQLRTASLSALLQTSPPLRFPPLTSAAKLDALCRRLGEQPHRLWEALEEDRLLLSQELGVLWEQFLSLFLTAAPVHAALAREHHLARTKRFAEGFFVAEDTLHSLLASPHAAHNMGFHTRLADLLKKSPYFARLPRLNAHVSETDGEPETMPIIFEEKFIHPVPKAGDRPASLPLTPPDSAGKDAVGPEDVFLSSPDSASLHDSPPLPHMTASPSSPFLLSHMGTSQLAHSTSEPNLSHLEEQDQVMDIQPDDEGSGLERRRSETDLVAVPVSGGTDIPPFKPKPSPTPEPVEESKNGVEGTEENGEELNTTQTGTGLGCCLPICASRDKDAVVPTTKASHRRAAALFKGLARRSSSSSDSPVQSPHRPSTNQLTSSVDTALVEFVEAKEAFKQRLHLAGYPGLLSSDFVRQAAEVPLFLGIPAEAQPSSARPAHLVVCVHGLEGSSLDLRPYRNYLRQGLPTAHFAFLMSEANEAETFKDFQTMSRNLVDEMLTFLSKLKTGPERISFVAHSLGNIIVRTALADPRLEPWLPKLHAFLSLNGPHCGVAFNRAPYDWGLSLIQWYKKSSSLAQLALRDAADPRQSFLYRLSSEGGLGGFRYVLLVGSKQDMYVPSHSALLQPCREGREAKGGPSDAAAVYGEMVGNLVEGLSATTDRPRTSLLRYTAFHGRSCMGQAHKIVGRAAHIAVLDDELFIEKLLSVSALQYFA